MTDLFRITAVRWAFGIALWSTFMTLVLFGFVYWQTAPFVQDELAHVVRHEVLYAAQQPDEAGEHHEGDDPRLEQREPIADVGAASDAKGGRSPPCR